jgi:Xaa-Pro dipeptidase
MRKIFTDKLVSLMNAEKLDAILICPSEELKFLSGFAPMMCERFQGLFIKNNGSAFYLCNLIYTEEAEQTLDGVTVHGWFDGDNMAESVYKVLEKENLTGKVIGVNSTAPAFSVLDIAAKADIRFVNAKPLLEETRIIKTADELAGMRISASIADKAFEAVIKFIKPGMTEDEVKSFLFSEMIKLGGSSPMGIVASGPNSSIGHYMGGGRVIEAQDIVLLDYCCVYNDMYSDMSRTLFIGGITEEQRKVYDTCRKSTEAGEAACFEGAFIPDIDKAARDVISASDYAKYFRYRVGHGIGYMVHEAPDIKASNRRKLEKGMCFSIEPGINIPGKFGMRVEDIVAITETGTEILNKSTHELIVI